MLTTGVHHLATLTEDLDRFVRFYVDVFDARVIDDVAEGGLRHAMVDVGGGAALHAFEMPDNPSARGSSAMFDRGHLDHYALSVADTSSFELLRDRLVAAGASDGTVTDFGSVRSVSFLDPDGCDGEVALWCGGKTVPFAERRQIPYRHHAAELGAPADEKANTSTWGRTMARAVGALVVAPLLVLGCGSDDEGGPRGASITASTTANSTEAAPSSPLAGTWRTAAISPTDAEDTLRREGLEEWIAAFRRRAPFEGETVLVLEIGDEWDLYGESDGRARAAIDFDASYQVDGDEVVVTHAAGSNTFRWTVVGDTLTLEWLESSMPAFEGVPEEVFQRALYTTAEFTRTPESE